MLLQNGNAGGYTYLAYRARHNTRSSLASAAEWCTCDPDTT